MSSDRLLSRRTLLRGLGASVALPWLDAMSRPVFAASQAKAAAAPLRMAFLYIPNGVHMAHWRPENEGALEKLPPTLETLAAFKDDLSVFSGLTQDGGRAHGDGPGDHARALSSFLTGTHPRKTDGADIKAGVSVDQVVAQKIGHKTRLSSLELGCDRGAQSGNCDSGYSCAYSSNISWRSESTPMPKEVNPRLVFDRLFGNASTSLQDRAKQAKFRRSILDFVAEDARDLSGRLGAGDRRKVDEYLTSIRELEVRIAQAESPGHDEPKHVDYPQPAGVPKDYREHIKLMFDLMALGFEADVTRVSTFVYGNEGSTRSYGFLGVPEGHHDLSHHGNDPEKHKKLCIINKFHLEMFAHFLGRLKDAKEGEGSVLDHSMIVYGSGISDGNRHNHEDLPVLMAGKGGGSIKPGRHVKYPRNTPLNNLYLSMLDRMGTPLESLGDSKGRLSGLEG